MSRMEFWLIDADDKEISEFEFIDNPTKVQYYYDVACDYYYLAKKTGTQIQIQIPYYTQLIKINYNEYIDPYIRPLIEEITIPADMLNILS
jgi:hypothetical protein